MHNAHEFGTLKICLFDQAPAWRLGHMEWITMKAKRYLIAAWLYMIVAVIVFTGCGHVAVAIFWVCSGLAALPILRSHLGPNLWVIVPRWIITLYFICGPLFLMVMLVTRFDWLNKYGEPN